MTSKFFMVGNGIFSHGLRPPELAVCVFLLRCRNGRDDTCFPSRRTIAEQCRMSISSVDRALKALCGKGLLEKEQRMVSDRQGRLMQSSNLYRLKSMTAL